MLSCEHNSKARKEGLCAKCSDLKPYTSFKTCKKQCFNCKECGWFYGSGAPDNLAGRSATFATVQEAKKQKPKGINTTFVWNIKDICKRCDIWHCKGDVSSGPTIGWCPKQDEDDEALRLSLFRSNQSFSDQKDLEEEIAKGFYLRGLGLYRIHCGILTKKSNRKHHDWVVITQKEKYWEFESFGEDYAEATRLGVKLSEHGIIAHLLLRTR